MIASRYRPPRPSRSLRPVAHGSCELLSADEGRWDDEVDGERGEDEERGRQAVLTVPREADGQDGKAHEPRASERAEQHQARLCADVRRRLRTALDQRTRSRARRPMRRRRRRSRAPGGPSARRTARRRSRGSRRSTARPRSDPWSRSRWWTSEVPAEGAAGGPGQTGAGPGAADQDPARRREAAPAGATGMPGAARLAVVAGAGVLGMGSGHGSGAPYRPGRAARRAAVEPWDRSCGSARSVAGPTTL